MKSLLPLLSLFTASLALAQPLPNTQPLVEKDDLARIMVDGLHKHLDRELAQSAAEREKRWRTPEPITAKRDRLRTLLGLVDQRVRPNLEYISGPGKPSLLATIEGCQIHAVRWAVLPGVDAEGFLIEPKGKPQAQVVAVPHCDQLPEEVVGLKAGDPFGLLLAVNGCRVLVPTLINRDDELSGNPRLKRQTNIPHREFLYRMAFELGRSVLGYEVQKVLAAVDYFQQAEPTSRVGVIGYGDGGLVTLLAGALDDRIHVTQVSGYFGDHTNLAEEPIDRNLWGRLREFGDAELAAMIAPRQVELDTATSSPAWSGPKPGAQAAPGKLIATREAAKTELTRYRRYIEPPKQVTRQEQPDDGSQLDPDQFLSQLGLKSIRRVFPRSPEVQTDPADRHRRQFEQLVNFTQKLWRDSEPVRKAAWTKVDASTPPNWDQSSEPLRQLFHEELIGKLPQSTGPLNARTRRLQETNLWTSYEVVLDVYPDVIAYGILCLPKGMKPGEKRAVVVCQHGLEGRPTDIVHPKENSRFYNSFGSKLADLGYIVYAPQNPYIFKNHFRQLQRKANPLKLSLFSFIIEQHRRTIDWLQMLPQVDPERIGFYGLSYGGKTAMRVPAVEKRYKLSICAGDFNEWLGKNVSVELPQSYMYTGEYEMFEFNLGHTFNYAEMAYLIAPRPFMVERGHDDGVGVDEMVAYEYAKVRYLYANRLKRPEHAEIEFRPGGHEIFLKGTLTFIEKHLGKP